MPGNWLRRLGLFLLAILSFAVLSAAIELVLVFQGYDQHLYYFTGQEPYRISSDAEAFAKMSERKTKTHIEVHLPEIEKALPKYQPPPQRFYSQKIEYDPQGVEIPDKECGIRMAANYHGRIREVRVDGTVNFDTRFSTDDAGRRVIPNQEMRDRRNNLIIFGGSNSAGFGVNDDETQAYYISELAKNVRVYNHSVLAWGPGNVLCAIQSHSFGSDISDSANGIALYVFHQHQIVRLMGSLNLYRHTEGWAKVLPNFEVDSNGHLNRLGQLSDRYLIDPVFRTLALSRILFHLGLEIPAEMNVENFRLFARVMKEIENSLRKRFAEMRFIVLFEPTRTKNIANASIAALDEIGIESLNYSQIDLSHFVNGPEMLPDTHPSKETNKFLAEQITRDLSL